MTIEPPWEITIEKALNGFVLKHLEQLSDNAVRHRTFIVQASDMGDDVTEFQSLCRELADYFGLSHLKITVGEQK